MADAQGVISVLGDDFFALVNRIKAVNLQLRAAGDALSEPLSEPEPEIQLTKGQAVNVRFAIDRMKEIVARLEAHANRLHMPR